MSFVPVNPRPMLQGLVNKKVWVRLKWGQTEYRGRLVSIDSYMNLQLSGTEEYLQGRRSGELGEVLIRCNNVLWVRGATDSDGDDADDAAAAASADRSRPAADVRMADQ